MTNSHVIRFTGSAELLEPLDFGKEFDLKLSGQVTNIRKSDNEDGSYTFIYSLRLLAAELVGSQQAKLNVKSSKSKRLRYEILQHGLDYEATMDKVIANLSSILEKLT